MEKLRLDLGGELSTRYELKTKGMEKIMAENEKIRKELKKVHLQKCVDIYEFIFVFPTTQKKRSFGWEPM